MGLGDSDDVVPAEKFTQRKFGGARRQDSAFSAYRAAAAIWNLDTWN